MDLAENESQQNYFDSTFNDTLTTSILPSLDPNSQEAAPRNQENTLKNQSEIFSSIHESKDEKSSLSYPPVPMSHNGISHSINGPALPRPPDPFGSSLHGNGYPEDEEEKAPPPPGVFLSNNPTPLYKHTDNKIARLIENDTAVSTGMEKTVEQQQQQSQGILHEFDEQESLKSITITIPVNTQEAKKRLEELLERLEKYHAVRFGALIKLESLGKGAFGEVFRVFDKDERKFYALKEIRRQAFEKEAHFTNTAWTEIHNLLKMHHAHDTSLLNLFGINLDPKAGLCAFLMELGRGTLHEYAQFRWNKGIAWKEEELLSVLYQLTKQLNALKNVGIFHRDVKPENIILTDKESNLKLSDLGCAYLTNDDGVQVLNVAGTPFFMPPELLEVLLKRQKQVEYNPYSGDLFSIGVTLMRVIQPSLKRSELTAFLSGRVQETYPKLYQYLKALMSEEPEIRRQTADEIISLETQKLSFTSQEETEYKSFLLQKIVNRNGDNMDPSLYFDMFIFDEAEIIIRNQITKEKSKANHTSLREVDWMIALAQCFMYQRKYELTFKELKDILELPLVQEQENGSLLTKAKALFWQGYTMAMTGKFEDAISKLNECLTIRQQILGGFHEDIAIVHLRLGYTYFGQGKYDDARKAFQECISINAKCNNESTLNVAKSNNNIGVILEIQKKFEEAYKYFEQALKIYVNLYGEDYPYVADQYNNIANVYVGQIKYSEANEYYYKALKIKEKYHGKESPEVALVCGNIASTFDKMLQFDEAIKYMKRSSEIYKKIYGEDHHELAHIYFLMGNTFSRQSKYQDALDYHLNALKIMKAYYGNENPHIIENCISCGKVYEQLANYDEAANCYKTALELHMNSIGANIRAVQIYKRLAFLYYSMKNTEEAMNYSVKAQETCSKVSHTTEEYECIDCNELMAIQAKKKKDFEQALEYENKVLKIKLAKFGESHHECGITYLEVGILNHKLKKLDQALSYYKKSLLILSKVLTDEHYAMANIYYRMGLLYKDQKKFTEASRELGHAKEIFTKCLDKKHPVVKKCQKRIAELNQLYLVQESEY